MTLNTTAPVDVIYVSPERFEITQLRMNLANILKGTSTATQLEVARIIDNNLVIPVVNGISGVFGAQYILGDLVAAQLGELDRLHAAHILNLMVAITASNNAVANAKVGSNLRIRVQKDMKNMVGLAIVGAEGNWQDIESLLQTYRNGHLKAVDVHSCLVFHYGLRVADAENLIRITESILGE